LKKNGNKSQVFDMNFTGDYRNIKVYGNQGVDTSNPKILKDEDRDRELD